jgi:hypothetical protein
MNFKSSPWLRVAEERRSKGFSIEVELDDKLKFFVR